MRSASAISRAWSRPPDRDVSMSSSCNATTSQAKGAITSAIRSTDTIPSAPMQLCKL